jgi:putative oxidoreductase
MNSRGVGMLIYQASPQSHRALGAFRILVGLLFVSEGTMKWFGYPPGPAGMPIANATSLLGMAGLIEMIGGLAIVLGLLTRPVAFILAGEMAVAYFHTHLPKGFFPTENNGMAAVLFCLIFLYLMFAGAGAWSVDEFLVRAASRAPAGAMHLPDLWPNRKVRPARVRGK